MPLSPREHQVLNLVASGRRYKEVAYELHISMSTVRYYLNRAQEKLKADTVIHAVALALQMGEIKV